MPWPSHRIVRTSGAAALIPSISARALMLGVRRAADVVGRGRDTPRELGRKRWRCWCWWMLVDQFGVKVAERWDESVLRALGDEVVLLLMDALLVRSEGRPIPIAEPPYLRCSFLW